MQAGRGWRRVLPIGLPLRYVTATFFTFLFQMSEVGEDLAGRGEPARPAPLFGSGTFRSPVWHYFYASGGNNVACLYCAQSFDAGNATTTLKYHIDTSCRVSRHLGITVASCAYK